MADIEKELKAIQEAVYGEEVRNAIHDAIQTCYDDGKAGAIDLVARGQIATKADKSELENVCGSDAYSNDKSYTVNDTCIHNNKLWKCIVACSGIEPPNATYWEEYTITGAISELNSTMSNKKIDLLLTDARGVETTYDISLSNYDSILITMTKGAENIASSLLPIELVQIAPYFEVWGKYSEGWYLNYCVISNNKITKAKSADNSTILKVYGIKH